MAIVIDQGGDSYKCISALTTISFKHIHIATMAIVIDPGGDSY